MPATSTSGPVPRVYTQEAMDKALFEIWEKIARMEETKQQMPIIPDYTPQIQAIKDELEAISERVNKPNLVEYIQFWKR
jgi:hypothetical protein